MLKRAIVVTACTFALLVPLSSPVVAGEDDCVKVLTYQQCL